jgi:Icc protein
MMGQKEGSFTIVQISDLHCGDMRFDEKLMQTALKEINEMDVDLVVVAGDLTAFGYREQYEEAKGYIEQIQCSQIIATAGNHDCRNVGFLHFEELFGPRFQAEVFDFSVYCDTVFHEKIKIIAADSNKPDLDDGGIGREHYKWIEEEFQEKDEFKVFLLHHHLISIPGTGRERNTVWDAGDVLAELHRVGVDLVLAGHRHVPYVWPVANMLVVHSGTVSTWRTRGYTKPSYNIIELKPSGIDISTKTPGEEESAKQSFGYRKKGF